MDILENLIGKSIDEIDSEIIESFREVNIEVAVLEYKYKNCGVRCPASSFKLTGIDYDDVISFEKLFYFDKIFIFWYYDKTITDLELFDITSDKETLKQDYDLIVGKIKKGEAHNIRAGDTRYLAAKRLNEVISVNDKKTNKRDFVLKIPYLQKILNEISLSYRY